MALIFAAFGTVQIRRQLEQGQHAVTANERSQLRAEYDVLTEIREECLSRQRNLERLGGEFPSLDGKSWNDLEELQYMLDGLFEYIGDIIREPYLTEVHGMLRAYHRKARRRMELYRASAELWRDGAIDDNKMLKRLVYVQTHCISDTDKLRRLVDGVIGPVGHQIAKLSRKKTKDWKPLLGLTGPTSRARKLAQQAEVYRNKKDLNA